MIARLAIVLLGLLACGCVTPREDRTWRGRPYEYSQGLSQWDRNPADLTFGTYNLHEMKDPDGLRADLANSAASVWAFQEVVGFPREAGATLEKILPPGPWWILILPMNKSDGVWESQAIASRWPITWKEAWPLPTVGSKHRAALVSDLETPAGIVRLVNTDHEVSFLSFRYGSNRQVNELVGRLKDDTSERLIVVGDFNSAGHLWSLQFNSGAVAALNESMRSADAQPLSNRTADDATFRDPLIHRQVDHIFLRGFTCENWSSPKAFGGSDHLPLVVRVLPTSRPANR